MSQDLTKKYNSVDLVKIPQVIGGKGGGGRKDFAQAGGIDQIKINDAFKAILKEINLIFSLNYHLLLLKTD